MKKKYFLFFSLLLTLTCFGQELLVNGDFETWDNANTPTNWNQAVNVDQESIEIHGGSNAIKHTGGTSELEQDIPGIISGKSYTISLWYKVDPNFGDGKDARIWSSWLNGSSTILDLSTVKELRGPENSYFDNNGNVWTQYKVTVTAPYGANGFRFEVRTYGNAVVYWDDFSFFAEATSTAPTLKITSPSNGSLDLNPNLDIFFIVNNFIIANGTGDGKIRYIVDNGTPLLKTDISKIRLTNLTDGMHTIYMELVDNSNTALSPAIHTTVNFTTKNIIKSLPLLESFDYTDGDNLGAQSFWTNINSGVSPVISSGSLSYPGLPQIGNSVAINGPGADPVIEFTPTSSGTIYASFILKVTSFNTTTTNGYFAILRNNSNLFRSRLWISPTSSTTFKIGLSDGSTLNKINTPVTDYSIGDELFIVFNYDIDNNIANAWVNPNLGGSEPVAELSEISGSSNNIFNQFMIRQDSTTETPGIVMDELRIGTTWSSVTPTTLSTIEHTIKNFNIHPNPTSQDYINIHSNSNTNMHVRVYNVIGKQVINTVINNNTLDVSSLRTGIYIVKAIQNGVVSTKKLVVK